VCSLWLRLPESVRPEMILVTFRTWRSVRPRTITECGRRTSGHRQLRDYYAGRVGLALYLGVKLRSQNSMLLGVLHLSCHVRHAIWMLAPIFWRALAKQFTVFRGTRRSGLGPALIRPYSCR